MTDFSFIVPVYNCKGYLPGCVESIRGVLPGRCEVILVDDGSTDGSGEVCDTLAGRYAEVRVIHQPNGGASAARNRGVREAAGERVLFVDADDSLEPERLGQILRDERCQKADLVIFGLTFDYYRGGKCYRRDPMFFDFDGILSPAQWGGEFVEMFRKNSLSPVWNKVFKREILLRNRLELDESMFLYEDLEFVLRYMSCCEGIWNVPQAVYHYRQAEDEGNAKRRLARIDRLAQVLEPIEAAMEPLTVVGKEDRKAVLHQLHLILANEKISVSDLAGIGRICEEFGALARRRGISAGETKLERKLLGRKVLSLWLGDKKTALRHAIAVRVKSRLARGGSGNGETDHK